MAAAEESGDKATNKKRKRVSVAGKRANLNDDKRYWANRQCWLRWICCLAKWFDFVSNDESSVTGFNRRMPNSVRTTIIRRRGSSVGCAICSNPGSEILISKWVHCNNRISFELAKRSLGWLSPPLLRWKPFSKESLSLVIVSLFLFLFRSKKGKFSQSTSYWKSGCRMQKERERSFSKKSLSLINLLTKLSPKSINATVLTTRCLGGSQLFAHQPLRPRLSAFSS